MLDRNQAPAVGDGDGGDDEHDGDNVAGGASEDGDADESDPKQSTVVEKRRKELISLPTCMRHMRNPLRQCCAQNCCASDSLPIEVAFQIRTNVWTAGSNHERNSVLLSHLPPSMSPSTKLMIGTFEVCRSAFCHLLGISKQRLYARFSTAAGNGAEESQSPESPATLSTPTIRMRDDASAMRFDTD